MNETTEFAILNDNYIPTEQEVKEMAKKLFDMETRISEHEDMIYISGSIIDIFEDFLESKGITKKDIPNKDRDEHDAEEEAGEETGAIIFGSDYDKLKQQLEEKDKEINGRDIAFKMNDENLLGIIDVLKKRLEEKDKEFLEKIENWREECIGDEEDINPSRCIITYNDVEELKNSIQSQQENKPHKEKWHSEIRGSILVENEDKNTADKTLEQENPTQEGIGRFEKIEICKKHIERVQPLASAPKEDICECGHKPPEVIILDCNELSYVAYLEYWEQKGKLCWDCFCGVPKKQEGNK